MRFLETSVTRIALMLLLGMGALAGCASTYDTTTETTPPVRVQTYPQGRYELYGDGSVNSPYYWVWVPASATNVPAPPPSPVTALQLGRRDFSYSDGRFEMHGSGTAQDPYYWVWVPSGMVIDTAALPQPPALPGVASTTGSFTTSSNGQRIYNYPEGRFEMYGQGTQNDPFYWVWIPAGSTSVPAPPPAPSITGGLLGKRDFTYAEGRYELRGNGNEGSPFYWAWIPNGVMGAAIPSPPPTPSPTASTTLQGTTPRVYSYTQGRYELYGDGTAQNPYYWVWVPANGSSNMAALPAPPPAPNSGMTSRVFSYPQGRYELHGDGTSANPYYWAWVPTGGSSASIPPLPPFPPRSS